MLGGLLDLLLQVLFELAHFLKLQFALLEREVNGLLLGVELGVEIGCLLRLLDLKLEGGLLRGERRLGALLDELVDVGVEFVLHHFLKRRFHGYQLIIIFMHHLS